MGLRLQLLQLRYWTLNDLLLVVNLVLPLATWLMKSVVADMYKIILDKMYKAEAIIIKYVGRTTRRVRCVLVKS